MSRIETHNSGDQPHSVCSLLKAAAEKAIEEFIDAPSNPEKLAALEILCREYAHMHLLFESDPSRLPALKALCQEYQKMVE